MFWSETAESFSNSPRGLFWSSLVSWSVSLQRTRCITGIALKSGMWEFSVSKKEQLRLCFSWFTSVELSSATLLQREVMPWKCTLYLLLPFLSKFLLGDGSFECSCNSSLASVWIFLELRGMNRDHLPLHCVTRLKSTKALSYTS